MIITCCEGVNTFVCYDNTMNKKKKKLGLNPGKWQYRAHVYFTIGYRNLPLPQFSGEKCGTFPFI
jgi:hypothetical protein